MPVTDLALLVAAARGAGDVAMRYFGKNPGITDKPDGAGPVTEADLAVNDMLYGMLGDVRPSYGWLSEETEDSATRLATKRQFVIDPIDGTRAFIAGNRDWAHSLAVVEDGQVLAAAVYLPARDLMFAAILGGGATVNDAPARVSLAALDDATVLAAKPNFEGRFWQGGATPPVNRAFRSSLAYRLCLVAQGRFDGMLTLRPSWEWDIAAGALIASEAGAVVTDQVGMPLRFNNPHPQVPGVLAAGPDLHAHLAQRLEQSHAKP
ncbi:3'(2'),5'-bisphosphate nucleotidase CysQ [Yoonia sp.]|uniref:3'(2'),5'-bisphosphate nucleotidase CysQ n=1 Tax=Yoonia sp. TaxID=2212373 RepID=UPI002600CE2C|nr:3'(2'),5'-bisphosphate nucleotidase CysQ [Yoonia sp.]